MSDRTLLDELMEVTGQLRRVMLLRSLDPEVDIVVHNPETLLDLSTELGRVCSGLVVGADLQLGEVKLNGIVFRHAERPQQR